jgi:hypothetical protein
VTSRRFADATLARGGALARWTIGYADAEAKRCR